MQVIVKEFQNKPDMYNHICKELVKAYTKGDTYISTLSNASAILKLFLGDINWVGFYLTDGENLYLGPFQGKPAVTQIGYGDGVCGTAALSREIQLISNVHECNNHIACDINSKSEIVLPVIKEDKLFALLDIDSPIYSRFDDEDREGLTKFCKELLKICDF